MRLLLPTLVLAALPLSGCASFVGDVVPFPQHPAAATAAYGPRAAYVQPVSGDGGGSIFAGATDGSGNPGIRLFQDNKAREVGDLLTVVLVESTSARSNAQTGISKNSTIGMGAPTLFGQNVTLNGRNVLEAEVEAKRGFNGQGNSTQSNALAGNITVTVIERLPNGNLRVAGEKQVRLNQGDELVQVQGIVRPSDVGPDNRVTSDRVGDARIVYGGRGAMARSNAMGWLGRFFNSAAAPY
ncbi:flagellar basal body L-ring protein FlgH [Luteimonas fraxinea]|uniref:Flagellar L-ring protein n=2 Tax=Luteimonas TaxID=83614 RepID=A0ABU7WHZ1_9GAMM|nr:flagellar basal body L-ring protein FlgH [Luteimonas fraxinea]MCD9095578.1 flagellar basal body L-ring protein FlgH [Luteimonas fraxinea]MCD9126181.1 flagellar basal body L-ring protein FlgH [Luteimonas fraxinea]UHH11226.1 flagellar basal body L-ring protein FlgH [Luteimonas fraxinea]